jgi:hypothetical protein
MKKWKSRSRSLYNTSNHIIIDVTFALGADSLATIMIKWRLVSTATFLLFISYVPFILEDATKHWTDTNGPAKAAKMFGEGIDEFYNSHYAPN